MGRDLTFYPKKASKAELKRYIESLGFQKCSHLWNWPKGTLNYLWFEEEDYKSIDGVSADIYPVKDEEKEYTNNEWALHIRNRYSASLDDVKKMNDVLREARKKFGGDIRGDYGKNRYAELWEDDSTPISRGISLAYFRVDQELRAVKFSLPDPVNKQAVATDEKDKETVDFINSMDPSRVLYNGLVPFAVSMFEYFFSQAFQVLIAYDEQALAKRQETTRKVEFSTLLQVNDGSRTIENVIASQYTFQNLNHLNKAYKEWLSIDVRAILFKKKKVGKSIVFLENKISDIIQYRHGIVHRFEWDKSLTKEDYVNMLEAIRLAMLEFIKSVEKKYKVKIEID